MRGYKVFNPDWTCLGMKYEVGKTYHYDGEIKLCESGYHFCKFPVSCWHYYEWTGEEKMAEVEASGKVVESGDGKCVTDTITIVAEIPRDEILAMCNLGNGNTGACNVGDCNAGAYNIGCHNTGSFNVGSWNSGIYNTGDFNPGRYNTGDYNAGYSNTGNHNDGNNNVGDWNLGSWNVGSWNSGSYNTGFFNTRDGVASGGEVGDTCVSMFDAPSSWSHHDWGASRQREILDAAPDYFRVLRINDMGPEEMRAFPSKTAEMRAKRQLWWDLLSPEDKELLMQLPNFDREKFEEILGGINIGEEDSNGSDNERSPQEPD